MAHTILVVGVLGLTLLTGSAATAEADGVKIFIDGHAAGVIHGRQFHPRVHAFPLHGQSHSLLFVVPRPIFVVPSPPPCLWVPGYWTSQWVPQSYTSNVWIPGQWSPDGTWIEGHYEARTVSTGYYQPVWLGGGCVP